MLGMARTLRSNALTSFEFLCIVERDGSLVYSAMPNGRAPATDFVLTAISADSATFENPAHDYPKKIQYSRRGDVLETAISGDGNARAQRVELKRESR
jgi:hypothetical protein